ncbi:MAG TPA: hypothetical protein VF067_04095, partial [Sphingomicrobium sp.]
QRRTSPLYGRRGAASAFIGLTHYRKRYWGGIDPNDDFPATVADGIHPLQTNAFGSLPVSFRGRVKGSMGKLFEPALVMLNLFQHPL